MQPFVDLYGKKLKKKPGHGIFFPTQKGQLVAFRDKNGNFQFSTDTGNFQYIDPEELEAREATRHLNNLCGYHLSHKGETATNRIVPVDIQFDGERQTGCPPLIRPRAVVEKIVKDESDPKRARNQLGVQMQIEFGIEYSGYLEKIPKVPTEEKKASTEAKGNPPATQKQAPKHSQSQKAPAPSSKVAPSEKPAPTSSSSSSSSSSTSSSSSSNPSNSSSSSSSFWENRSIPASIKLKFLKYGCDPDNVESDNGEVYSPK